METVSIEFLYKLFLDSEGVFTDTRKVLNNGLFIALKGANFNGNIYAEKAIENGAKYAIVDDENIANNKTIFLVESVLETLQNLANFHRKKLQAKVIAITGTNGKTTTKELLYTVLGSYYNCFATQGNFNNHIGVPLTILSAKNDLDFLIVEMGANHQYEIEELCKIAEPDFGIITNVGIAHIEGFGSSETIKHTKKELFDFVIKSNGKFFYNSNEPTLSYLPISQYSDNILTIEKNISLIDSFPRLVIDYNGTKIPTNLFGSYNANNIIAAIGIGENFNIPKENISKAISGYIPTNNRSELIEIGTNKILLDAYNANPTSYKVALESFSNIDSNNKILILGEMKELGEIEEQEHLILLENIWNTNPDKVYLVGSIFNYLPREKLKESYIYKSVEELIEEKVIENLERAIVLIKGSRSNKLEQLVK